MCEKRIILLIIAYRHDSFQALGTFEVDNTDICSYLLYQQHTACYADIDN